MVKAMKKQFIKLNNNDEHLSLGNFFRIIKTSSQNKTSALQTELFCTLFDIEDINDTTVNNYCVGCRSIGSEYKQIFLNKTKKFSKDKTIFTDNIIGLLNIIDGVIHTVKDDKIAFINNSESAIDITNKLFNLAKNDHSVNQELINKVHSLINNNDYYDALVELLIFIVLSKKQPLYEEQLKKEVLENIVNDTSISSLDLQEFLSLKLREGINYDFSLKKLAEKGNAYANFELGSNEYYGYVTGLPRYDIAYKYFIKAALVEHATANYMLANMYINGLIGSQSPEELEQGYAFLIKSYNLGNVAASNMLGNMYNKGIYPLKKDEKLAIKYYQEASSHNFAFAFNNLGSINERHQNLSQAFNYYLKAADLGESWACNKVGEFYRLGIVTKDLQKAFTYYNNALQSNHRTLCYYAYYNLAKYFYYHGLPLINLERNPKLAIEYMQIASQNHIFLATLELFYIAVTNYLNNKTPANLELVYQYKNEIEQSSEYNEEIRKKITKKINELTNVKKIDIECLK